MKIKKVIETTLLERTDSDLINFIRYGFVGAAASAVDLGTYSILIYCFALNVYVATTASFVLGLLTNYFLSRSWVFNQDADTMNTMEFVLFGIIGVGGLFLSYGVLYLLIDLGLLKMVLTFLNTDMIKLVAKIIAMVVTLVWNYILRKRIYR